MKTKQIIILLLINVFLLILFTFYFTTRKNNEVKVERDNIVQSAPLDKVSVTPVSKEKILQNNKIESTKNNSMPSETKSTKTACMLYGPLTNNQKQKFEHIIKLENISNVQIEKKVHYDIYWNLGPDKQIAEQLFSRQKNNGVFKEDRYKLIAQNNAWVVLITSLNGNNQEVRDITQQLANKADSVNAGGTWEYRSLEETIYYKVPDISKFSESAIQQINKGLDLPRLPC